MFYQVNAQGLPTGLPIQEQDIITEVSDRSTGWQQVDLSSYNLHFVGNKKIAVTLQWIESIKPDEQAQVFMLNGSYFTPEKSMIFRDNAFSNWTSDKNNLNFYMLKIR